MYGPGNYIPPVRTIYWSMRVMVYAGSLVALVALVGAFLLWKRRLERLQVVPLGRRLHDVPAVRRDHGRLDADGDRPAAVDRAGPAEDGRRELAGGLLGDARLQPHRVRRASTLLLLVLDIWLMRRYAKVDPPELDHDEGGATLMPAIGVLRWTCRSSGSASSPSSSAGYFVLEGFDFGVGHAAAVPAAERGGPRA